MLIAEIRFLIPTCLILVHFIQTPSYAQQYPKSNSSCNPSACGNIHTISYPFRLKDDPDYCGHQNRSYEISCENNTTSSVYVGNYKYHVRAINYQNYTIRLSDPSIENNDSCSFPTYSPNWRELMLSTSSAYVVSINRYWKGKLLQSAMLWPVTFLSCSYPPNDPLFIETKKNIVTLTAAWGTIGYVAPELINRSIGGVSYKADVYSFGMLLVELVGLKRNLAANDDNSSTQYFPHCIYDFLNKDNDIEIAKTADIVDDSTREITRRMTIVALWCIQMSPDHRPSMSKVLEMLETDVELLQIPPQPSEFDEQMAQDEDQTWGICSTSDYTALLCDGSSFSQDL